MIFKLPGFLYRKSFGRFISPVQTAAEEMQDDGPESLEDAAIDSATAINANDESDRRKPKVRRRI